MDISLDIQGQELDFIAACKAREEWALKELYEGYYGKLLPICQRYAKDDQEAQDLLHDGFIKAFNKIDKYQIGTSLEAWLKRLMINSCIDHYRKQKKYRSKDIGEAFYLEDPDPLIVDTLNAEEIIKAIQYMAPSYRVVFNMYIIEGYTHREIAEKLGVSESTSRSNLLKARKKLQGLLKSRGI